MIYEYFNFTQGNMLSIMTSVVIKRSQYLADTF